MFPQVLPAGRTPKVLQSKGKLQSGGVQGRDWGWGKCGREEQEIAFLYSISGKG